MQMKYTLLILLTLFVNLGYSQENLEDGLFFASKEVIQDKRTSLNLTPEKPLDLNKGFILEFESKFRQKDAYYGNIFKIVGNKSFNIDLISNFEGGLNSKNPIFLLIVNNTILHSFYWKEIPNGGIEKWIKFKLEIESKNSSISLSINGVKKSLKVKEIVDLNSYEIVFGKSNLKNFVTSDVSPMSLKHIKIFEGDQLIRNWNLGKHLKNNAVYDEISNDFAQTKNPIWLLDQHLYWKKNTSLQFKNLLGTAQDEKKGLVFFIDQKAVYVYNLKNQVLDTLNYSNSPYHCLGNNFIYNPNTAEIWSYTFEKNTISKFNFATSTWSQADTNCAEPNFWHHNKMISPKDGNLITFGGYGHYKYKNSTKIFDTKNSNWKSINNNTIEPRYLSSSGILNADTFLIFGGYGSKSGNQAINSHCFYDLYTVDFATNQSKLLWKKETLEGSPFVPIGSMIIDSKKDHFYSLIYDNNTFNTTLRLARFGINTFEMELFPETVPYKFLDIKSNGSLFLDANDSKLYVITTNENTVNLHSLAYPPLLASDVFQEKAFSMMPYGYLAVLLILLLVAGWYFISKKTKSKKTTNLSKTVKIQKVAAFENPTQEEKEEVVMVHNKIKTSSIYLFGGFEVFDKEGKDITALFTPTLKQLFLLILLSKSKNEKGITSNKIIENIWYDKSENSARNNKNVNISKLKLLLEKIGDVALNNENTYWNIEFQDSVFCDYSYVLKLLSNIKTEANDDAKILAFLSIISAGEFCPDVQNEWIEPFKVDISNRVIDGLDYLSKNKNNLNLLEQIANTILKFDPLSEEAIVIKCSTLYKMGKKGPAKQAYDEFCKEYLNLLDAKFNISFKDIIEG